MFKKRKSVLHRAMEEETSRLHDFLNAGRTYQIEMPPICIDDFKSSDALRKFSAFFQTMDKRFHGRVLKVKWDSSALTQPGSPESLGRWILTILGTKEQCEADMEAAKGFAEEIRSKLAHRKLVEQ